MPPQITVGDLNFTVRESEQRHTVGITVDRDGSLLLLTPAGANPDAVGAWAWSKRHWVFRKLADKHLLLPASQAKEFITGEGFDYLGRHYRLQLTVDPLGTAVRFERGRLLMPRATARADQGGPAMIRWYRRRAQVWLPRRIRSWAATLGVQPGNLEVRGLGYRWGSLGNNDRLNIHWAVMQLPVSLVDYVIVHELAHIGQPRHSAAFWATVERALPDQDHRRERLAATGSSLWLG